ncbi:hypothetical protein, partial [Lutibacter sp. HS1-25]|uniref:hypothetical protein n=1 Tax=Lutibacter sp. HS1-25 TaxID=2485000 RepID=UPI0013E981EF
MKYVDEVKVVAPFSKKELTSIESKYNRHSALDAESHDIEKSLKSLRQAQTDNTQRHPEPEERHSAPDAESHDFEVNDEILKSKIHEHSIKKRLVSNQVQHDETQCHPMSVSANRHSAPDAESHDIEKNVKSPRQAQTDNTQCHPEPVEGSHDMKSNDELLKSKIHEHSIKKRLVSNQVQHDETQCHPMSVSANRHSAPDAESHDIEKNVKSPRQAQTDNTQCHPEPVEGSHDMKSNDELLKSKIHEHSIKKRLVSNQVQHDETQCHPMSVSANRHSAPDAESHDIEKNVKSPRQAQTDNTQCHPEPVEGSHDMKSNDELLKSKIHEHSIKKRLVSNQVQHDETQCHPMSVSANRHSAPDAESHDIEKNVKSPRQAQTDNTQCHPEPVEGSHDMKSNDELLKSKIHEHSIKKRLVSNQVQHDETQCHPMSVSANRHSAPDAESHDIEKNVKSPRQAQTDNTQCHPEPVEGSHDMKSNDELLKSKIHEHSIKKRLVSNQVQHDETQCHPMSVSANRHSAPDAESHDIEKNVKSPRQAQTDNTQCHPEPVEGS